MPELRPLAALLSLAVLFGFGTAWPTFGLAVIAGLTSAASPRAKCPSCRESSRAGPTVAASSPTRAAMSQNHNLDVDHLSEEHTHETC